LKYLEAQKRDHQRLHSVWQDIQAKNIFTNEFLIQKMEYIHSNPIRKKWALVTDRADYRYSSACFYDRAEQPLIAIDDVRDWLG
jgi:hypothetical protein